MAVRFTVYSAEQTVSFEGDAHLAYCLVAACADAPRLLEDLLVAVEPYAAGTAERVIQGLLDFDRARAARSARPSALPLPVVEVIDAATEFLSETLGDEGLITIDLVLSYIGGHLASLEPIAPRGVVSLDVPGAAGQKVAYALPNSWTVDVETRAPSARGELIYA
jgi:microcompartment protein CcmK/EutM